MTIPLTGAQYEIEAGAYRATVTELGGGLRALTHDGRPLVTGFAADDLPPHGAGQLLTPWPNRIDGGTYEFGGAAHHLPLSEPAHGNAIHGLTRWTPWSRVAHEPGEVTLRSAPLGQIGYPFAVQVDVTYRLESASGLHVTVTAANKGSRPAPWGTGQHPYLSVATPTVDDCELTLPADRWLPVNDRGIPSGDPEDVAGTDFDFRAARRLAGTKLDHAFTGLRRDNDGLAWVRLEAGGARSALWADAAYRWLQVFTGDPLEPAMRRTALAVEPMTCPPNAFVSGTDLLVLPPGESVSCRWGIRSFAS
ncbi:MAG TPA: aldose 1-epimerase family protein [Trebonia sp.]|jgi:aldose 1-epimerase|nr:aldose 1-epimerase family protein [Trebonia sp.]